MKQYFLNRFSFLFIFIILLSFTITHVNSLVIGIDLGGQWMKVAVIKPGFIDIVLNEQSFKKNTNSCCIYTTK